MTMRMGLWCKVPSQGYRRLGGSGNVRWYLMLLLASWQPIGQEVASNVYPKTIPLSRPQALPRIAPASTSRG